MKRKTQVDYRPIYIFFLFAAEVIPQMYEMALKQNPQNEELNTHLFMAYVRIEDYKKQKQVMWFLSTLYLGFWVKKAFDDLRGVSVNQ